MIDAEIPLRESLIREITNGFELERHLADQRQMGAAIEAHRAKGHRTIKGLGKQVLEVDQRDFFRAMDKFGPECWSDRGFIKDVQRLEPDLKVYSA